MKRNKLTLLAITIAHSLLAQLNHERVYSSFDNLPLSKSDTFDNGASGHKGFTHYGRHFANTYDSTWSSWSGWALSNMTDTETQGFTNQYSAISGHGVSHTPNYMVSTGDGAYIKLDVAAPVKGAYFNNSTYAYYDMKNGSGFSKKFGGDSGNDPDFLRIIIRSYFDSRLVDTTVFYLADYRYQDNSKDYLINDWTFVDFNTDLQNDALVDSISFHYQGSDMGSFGLNTPKYFCMDDFNGSVELLNYNSPFFTIPMDTFYNGSDLAGGIQAGPYHFANKFNSMWGSWSGWSYSTMQDDSTPGFENQFSCIDGSSHFYVAGGAQNEIRTVYLGKDSNTFSTNNQDLIFSVNNSTYAYLDMLNGSAFSKKFGGEDGTDPDYFRLITRFVNSKNEVIEQDTVYLADYRFENSADDYILKDFAVIYDAKDFSIDFHKMVFNLESSDNGMWGMNTPAFFCLYIGIRIMGNISVPKEDADILIFPNPVQNKLYISTKTNIQTVTLFGIDGKQIAEANNIITSKNTSVNTHNLTPGIYFVRVQTDKGIATKKFIKQ